MATWFRSVARRCSGPMLFFLAVAFPAGVWAGPASPVPPVDACATEALGSASSGEITAIICATPCGVYGCTQIEETVAPGYTGSTCVCAGATDPPYCCHLVAGNNHSSDPPGWWAGVGYCGGTRCDAGECTVFVEYDGDDVHYSADCEVP